MDLFQETSRISVMSIIFGGLTLTLTWLIYIAKDPINQLVLGETALIFLALFFYSLTTARLERLEEIVEESRDKKQPRTSLVP